MSRIFQFPLYHIFCEMQLGLQLSLYSYHDLLIRHFVPPTYPEYHSVTPHFKIITFVFFTLISIPYSWHVVLNLSIIFCIFFLFSATNTASSAYLRFVIFTPPNPIPSTPSMASCIINSLYRLKSIGDITQPCLTPLSTPTSLLTSPSHLTAACCLQ